MYEFDTQFEFFGEGRPCRVSYDTVDGECVIRAVEVSLLVEHNWTPSGQYRKWTERMAMDMKPIMSDDQIWSLVEQIRADRLSRAAEDFDDTRLLDSTERWCRLYGHAPAY